jgi:hypothetical protein
MFIHLSMVSRTRWIKAYRGIDERFQEVFVPPKLAIDAVPKRGIVVGFIERVYTFAISERGPISKGLQVLEESTLPLEESDLLLLSLKRIREV